VNDLWRDALLIGIAPCMSAALWLWLGAVLMVLAASSELPGASWPLLADSGDPKWCPNTRTPFAGASGCKFGWLGAVGVLPVPARSSSCNSSSRRAGSATDGSDWDGSDCDGSDCDGSDCDGSDCDGSDCDGSDCDGSDCDGSDCDGSDCDGSDCDGSDCDGSDCDGSDCDGSDCDGTTMYDVKAVSSEYLEASMPCTAACDLSWCASAATVGPEARGAERRSSSCRFKLAATVSNCDGNLTAIGASTLGGDTTTPPCIVPCEYTHST